MQGSEPIPIDSLLEHDAWLRSMAARLASDGAEVEELVQETWLAALRRPPSGEGGDARGWLRRVLENVQRQMYRGASRRAERERLSAAGRGAVPSPEDIELRLELRRQVLDEVQALAEPQRRVLVMRYFEGHSLRRVAQLTGVPPETVKSQHARGLLLLRERLDRRAGSGQSWLSAFAPLLAARLPRAGFWFMSTSTKVALVSALVLLTVSMLVIQGSDELPVSEASSVVSDDVLAEVPLEGAVLQTDRRRALGVEPSETMETPEQPLADPASEVRGRVFSSDGRPLAGAQVRGGGTGVESDFDGVFTWPLGESAEQLTASAPDMISVVKAWARPGMTRDLVLVLAPVLRIAGHVVDQESLPLSGTAVQVRLEETWARHLPVGLASGTTERWTTQTDEHGAFSLSQLPRVPDALIWVGQGGDSSLYRLPTEDRFDLRLIHGEKSLEERWANIEHLSGRVVTRGGEPSRSARVCAGESSRRCDAQGRFRIPMSSIADTAEFVVYETGRLPVVVSRPGGVTGDWPSFVEVVLDSPEVGRIRGRVIDAQGEGLAQRQVWLTNPSPHSEENPQDSIEELIGGHTTETDEEGRFELCALPDRSYILATFDPESRQRVEYANALAGDHELQLVIGTVVDRRDLNGRCMTPNGKPIAGVELTPQWRVVLENGERVHEASTAVTDEMGRFHFEAIPTSFDSIACAGLGVMPQWLETSFESLERTPLVIRRRAEIRVSTANTGAHYFMLNTHDGERAELARFQWIMDGKVEGSSVTYWGELEEGTSTTYTVAEGSYELTLFVGEEDVARVDVELEAGERNEILVD